MQAGLQPELTGCVPGVPGFSPGRAVISYEFVLSPSEALGRAVPRSGTCAIPSGRESRQGRKAAALRDTRDVRRPSGPR